MCAVKNFFSGVESTQHFDAAKAAGARHLLMSYLYVTKQQGNVLQQRKQASPNLRFMIDSGAHTLQVSMGKAPYNTWKLADFEKYVTDYCAWLWKNRSLIFAAVELDIAYSVNVACGKAPEDSYGDSIVDEWRRRLFIPLQEKGMNIIYVWHPAQGHQGWETLCANFPYVGLPGEMSKNEDFNVFMSVAKRYTTKVHGFAATKQSDFRDWPWYSIDSTTWKAGEIYGTLPIWDERKQRLRFYSKADNREEHRQTFIAWGLDADAVINDTNYQEVTRASLKSMTAMEEFYRSRYAKKIFYYQLRLPHPNQVRAVYPFDKVKKIWTKFGPEQAFPKHCHEQQGAVVQDYVHAIACVQYRSLHLLSPRGRKFLESYFADQMKQQIPDTIVIAKELAILTSPPNEVAQRRLTEDDYVSLNNPPKARDARDLPSIELEDEQIPGYLLDYLNEH